MKRLLCLLTLHKWSAWRLEWSFTLGDDVLYRQCSRCRKSERKDYGK